MLLLVKLQAEAKQAAHEIIDDVSLIWTQKFKDFYEVFIAAMQFNPYATYEIGCAIW